MELKVFMTSEAFQDCRIAIIESNMNAMYAD